MSESVLSYAALVLADSDKEVSAANLKSVLDAAGASVEQIWIDAFAKALAGQDIKEQLFKMSSAATAAPAAAAPAAGDAAADDEKKDDDDEDEDEDEDEDVDMGMGLFN